MNPLSRFDLFHIPPPTPTPLSRTNAKILWCCVTGNHSENHCVQLGVFLIPTMWQTEHDILREPLSYFQKTAKLLPEILVLVPELINNLYRSHLSNIHTLVWARREVETLNNLLNCLTVLTGDLCVNVLCHLRHDRKNSSRHCIIMI